MRGVCCVIGRWLTGVVIVLFVKGLIDNAGCLRPLLKGFVLRRTISGLNGFPICSQGCRKLQPWARISERLRRYQTTGNNVSGVIELQAIGMTATTVLLIPTRCIPTM